MKPWKLVRVSLKLTLTSSFSKYCGLETKTSLGHVMISNWQHQGRESSRAKTRGQLVRQVAPDAISRSHIGRLSAKPSDQWDYSTAGATPFTPKHILLCRLTLNVALHQRSHSVTVHIDELKERVQHHCTFCRRF